MFLEITKSAAFSFLIVLVSWGWWLPCRIRATVVVHITASREAEGRKSTIEAWESGRLWGPGDYIDGEELDAIIEWGRHRDAKGGGFKAEVDRKGFVGMGEKTRGNGAGGEDMEIE